MFQPFGPWAEWACLAAIDTLALACLAAASALPRERWAGGVLVFAAGFLLPFFFSATPTGSYAAQYVNAMADLPLAMLFGGTLCLYFAVVRRKIAYWLVALPLAVLAGVCYNFCVYFAAEPQLMGQNPALYENVSRLVQFWL